MSDVVQPGREPDRREPDREAVFEQQMRKQSPKSVGQPENLRKHNYE